MLELNKVYNYGWADGMKQMDNESVHLIFTAPYYNTWEYSSYSEYLHFMENMFSQCHRILQEGRFLVLNTSSATGLKKGKGSMNNRYGVPFDLHAILMKEEGKWDFVDDIICIKPKGYVKNRNGVFYKNREPLAYSPNIATEYIMVYRKHTKKLIDWNIKKYKKGDENIYSKSLADDDFERTNVWKMPPSHRKYHPSVYSREIVDRVVKYYSYTGDVVLDPLMAQGDTAYSAMYLKRNYIGFEIDKGYCSTVNNCINILKKILDDKEKSIIEK